MTPARPSVTFTVPGAPVSWARARRVGKRYFTGADQSVHRGRVQLAWRVSGSGGHPIPAGTAACVIVEFFIPRPRTVKKGDSAHTQKPDLDNLVKLVLDALNGCAWVDDVQVTQVHATKAWAPVGDEGSTVITVVDVDHRVE